MGQVADLDEREAKLAERENEAEVIKQLMKSLEVSLPLDCVCLPYFLSTILYATPRPFGL